ncbi:protein of unknown function [Actinopolyspora mzabensis]|uniref:DUF397 domain-containing protein n=1 Tax=Actinopolyspora mzabensis TaxID=995066 RepID=A0A1G9E7N3_ACTMZ|nr:DUF397 domain-containing protein [Actinopolyspora mzabensis]SDK72142.1 protein of unknown function [Actinopolyspora mzabensis]
MSNNISTNSLVWRKSSRSGGGGTGGGNCVEVAFGEGFAAVRDSKSPEKGMFAMPAAQWRSFLSGLHTDRYEYGS